MKASPSRFMNMKGWAEVVEELGMEEERTGYPLWKYSVIKGVRSAGKVKPRVA